MKNLRWILATIAALAIGVGICFMEKLSETDMFALCIIVIIIFCYLANSIKCD